MKLRESMSLILRYFALLVPVHDIELHIDFVLLLFNLLAFSSPMYTYVRQYNIAPLPASFTAIALLFVPHFYQFL
jgi:hypothetical protein